MMRRTQAIAWTMMASAVALAASAVVATAQPYDHLKCFKVKDSLASFTATADLRPVDTIDFELDAGCAIKVRSRELCVPVNKDRVDEGPSLAVAGPDLTNAFICYTIKCRGEVLPAQLLMSDQFGSRQLSGLHTTRLCAPAVFGTPPPTTTTTTLPHGPPVECASATVPACDGTCGDQNLACEPDVGGTACICKGVDIFAPCGQIAGPPNCYGTCNGDYSCVDAGGGACACSLLFQ
ncbi:MAG: hypothetical protein HY899_06265 [Deltaproteobacteria bacterium]|nr:hypothetical protein [Deltaproteobacteria bacterium]